MKPSRTDRLAFISLIFSLGLLAGLLGLPKTSNATLPNHYANGLDTGP